MNVQKYIFVSLEFALGASIMCTTNQYKSTRGISSVCSFLSFYFSVSSFNISDKESVVSVM